MAVGLLGGVGGQGIEQHPQYMGVCLSLKRLMGSQQHPQSVALGSLRIFLELLHSTVQCLQQVHF